MVCSTDRSKAVVPVLVLLFVALWFILRGDLLYVFLLFLCFSVLLVLRLPRLGKRELILVLFVRLFSLCLFRFVGFLFLLGSGKGCGLWLWHSLDFSLTFFAWLYIFVYCFAPGHYLWATSMNQFLKGTRSLFGSELRRITCYLRLFFFYPKTIQSYYHESIISHDVFP